MWSLKLFGLILLLCICLISSEAEEQAEGHIITEPEATDNLDPVEPRSKSTTTDGLHREGKRKKGSAPNVHIENIYIPQQIQKGDETIEGYPIFPVYSYPLKDASPNRKPSNTPKPTKPKPSSAGTDLTNQTPSSLTQQPYIVYNPHQQTQGNAFIPLPYTGILPKPYGGQEYPYFIIINSPGHQQAAKPLHTLKPEVNDKDDKEADEIEEEEATASKPKKKPHLGKAPGQLKLSRAEANIGLSIAKYLLGHPLYSANDMERSAQSDNEMLALDDAEEDDEDGDTIDQEEDASSKYSGNIDTMSTKEDEDFDDFAKIEELLKEREQQQQQQQQQQVKGNKLPVDFVWDHMRPRKKLDDRVALVFLRHTKRGRKLVMAEN